MLKPVSDWIKSIGEIMGGKVNEDKIIIENIFHGDDVMKRRLVVTNVIGCN